MGNKKSRLKRGLVLALTLALVGNGMSSTMLTALAEETEGKVTGTSEVGAPKEPAADQPEAEGEKKDTQAGQKQEDVKSDPDGAGEKKSEKDSKAENAENAEDKLSRTFTETVIPDSAEEFPDNDELFAGYVDQLFFGELNSDIAPLADFGKEKLTGVNLESYNILKEEIKKIAAGNRASTEIGQSIVWSAADLGLNSNATMKQISDAAVKKFEEEYNLHSIINYLLMDFPYELYWYNKTAGTKLPYSMGYQYEDNKYHIDLTYQFAVAKGYQGSAYQIDTTKAKSAATAAATAKNIVKKYEGKSDYEKLDGYRQEICDLVSYNNDAANNKDTPYGDPWQLIWVFDGDTTTNVVCEGYSKAFQYLCDLSQFSGADTVCYTVSGNMSGGTGAGPHMWNIVTLEGKNYLVDVTNCDTGTIGATKELFLAGTNGSVGAGYIFKLAYNITYEYDDEQLGLFGESILTLANEKYVPKGLLDITVPAVTVTYGDAAGGAVLQGGVAKDPQGNIISGSFAWASDVTSYGNAGTKELKAIFTPSDSSAGFEPQIVLVKVIVNRRPVTVTARDLESVYGEPEAALVYTIDSNTPLVGTDKLSGELSCDKGNANAGSYRITQGTLTNGNNPNYSITYNSGTYLIKPTDKYRDNTATVQNILQDVGKFTEPVFAGVNGELVKGSVTYTYNSGTFDYDTLVNELSKLDLDANGTIGYTFVPVADGNYTGNKTGSITFTIKDIEFTVDNKPATVNNAVTIKSNPVYGDQWSEIVKITSTITAKAGNGSDAEASHFKLSVSGIPNAGEQSFQVLYNGTVDGKKYTDAIVCEGKVNIAKRTLKVLAGDYKVTKVYDGTTSVENVTTTGELKVDGILTKDTDVKVNGILDGFTNPNAGIDKEIKVNLALTGQNAENYKLENDTVAVSCAITPQSITPTVAVNGSYIYTGTAVIPEIVVMNGQSILDAAAYEVSCSNNVNAGQATVTVSPKAGGNYTWTPVKTEFAIGKAEYDNDKRSASQSTKYGNADTYNLASILPEGAKLGTITAVDEFKILEAQPSVKDNVLSYKLSAGRDQVGQTATITIPVTETTNYNPFNITFTITVADKESQNDFKFDVTELKKTYGDGDFAVVAANAAEGSTVTYKSSEPSVATVDAASGNVHILRKGTTTITATASETNDYLSKSISYTLTVSPKALTWDVSGLQAVDKQGTVDKDKKKASLYGELRVSGIVPADNGKVSFSCPAGKDGKLIGTYADTKPGAQKVTLTWADEPVVLTGTDVDNYTLPAKLPEITGRINAVSEQTNVPESTDTVKYKLEVEDGISQVPDTLVNNPELNTPAKIEEKMKSEIRVSLKEESNQNSIEVYDVVLMVKDGDGEWEVATEENFPKDGLTVTLPYPEGTGKDTHNFEIAHMFTHNWNGREAGQIEHPKASKINEGIQFKVTSLSPIVIGWKEIKSDNTGANGNTNTNATTPNKSRSPQTGDENVIMLYVLLMMLGAAGVGYTMKRRATR